jgi:F0F1-type ATP synthase delta subunit
MYIKDYIEATYSVLQKDTEIDAVLTSLSTYLNRRGLFKLYPSILRGLIDKSTQKEKGFIPKIVIAREKDLTQFKSEIETHLSLQNSTKTIVDPTIIGGFIIKTKDTYIDRSHKTKLLQTYHRVTN